mmetsp:Transcript_58/g.92  ORF Transcript_58/g.92 Transcript_58/m.92 type:complete len:622 (-) Transcript_58:1906-3771(-)|eukprot:CAMPEP_0182449280 /NCGR_PEP_ID=MMETSP1172-20130603/33052_1 /TAXON_ID=708627 /ORGANISM="Timspurckia oligopyrenoides, Strain CCMP3278" /LENGTH=621 /DNA_ID=CAMNT_0024646483 /DNA_START=352 /DNA_END=2217 /DNA_ORIENTATION=+
MEEDDAYPGAFEEVASWKAFALDSHRFRLDETARLLAEQVQLTARERKSLAEQTREFKRKILHASDFSIRSPSAHPNSSSSSPTTIHPSTGPNVPSEFASETNKILKAYQREIDRLTQRAKKAEAVFFWLYRWLDQLPDPSDELDSAESFRIEVERLKANIAAADIERRRSEEQRNQIKAEFESLQNELEDRMKLALQNASKEQSSLTEAFEMREQELLHQLSLANEQLRAWKCSNNSGSRLPGEAYTEEPKHIHVEAEVARAETIPDSVRDTSSNWDGKSDVCPSSVDVNRLIRMLQERDDKILKLEHAQATMVPESEYKMLEEELTRRKVASEEARRLGQLVLSESRSGTIGSERQLVAKVKALEHAFCELHVTLFQKERELIDMRRELHGRIKSENLEASAASSFCKPERHLRQPSNRDMHLDVDHTRPSASKAVLEKNDFIVNTSSDTGQESVIQMICSQRDRLHSGLLGLEEENRQLLSRIESMFDEQRVLRSENIELYEAVHHLRASMERLQYSQSASSGNVSSPASSPSAQAMIPQLDSKLEDTYRDAKQKQGLAIKRGEYRRIVDMGRTEQFTVLTGEKLFRNRKARVALVLYVLLLHILVYFALASPHSSTE